jgi:hypothetical protein
VPYGPSLKSGKFKSLHHQLTDELVKLFAQVLAYSECSSNGSHVTIIPIIAITIVLWVDVEYDRPNALQIRAYYCGAPSRRE